MYKGVYTAIVTPFKNQKIDFKSYEQLILSQIEGGVSGIVPTGTTGESATLSHQEHIEVIKKTIEFSKNGKSDRDGKVQIIAGTGSNSTSEAVAMTKEAERLGVDGALLVSPYYNKPSQEGLYQHFKTIADSVNIPIMLYNIPGRTSVSIEIETIKRLVESCSNINSIKEAGGDVNRVTQMKKNLPDDFIILSGDDPKTIEFMNAGAKGVVSVVSNLLPKELSKMVSLKLENKDKEAKEIENKYNRLFTSMLNLATNPLPIKTALYLLEKIELEFRLPMTPMEKEKQNELKDILLSVGL